MVLKEFSLVYFPIAELEYAWTVLQVLMEVSLVLVVEFGLVLVGVDS